MRKFDSRRVSCVVESGKPITRKKSVVTDRLSKRLDKAREYVRESTLFKSSTSEGDND